MNRLSYGDFDEFADCISGVAGRFVPTARSTGDWWIERVSVDGLDLQRLQIGSATTYAGDGIPGTLTFGIPTSDPSSIRIDGQGLAKDTFLLIRNDRPFTSSARQLSRWCTVTVQLQANTDNSLREDVVRLASALEFEGARARTELPHLDMLRGVIERICTDHETVTIVDPAATVAAQEEVMHTLLQALEATSHANDRHIGRPQVSRTRVIARCLELIDASEGQPLFIDDLCSATQVSERTLRNIFQEFFGVGPMRLLKVRQLREIRSALLGADPLVDTVTRIAARFGVWDFSLFARNYRALYGEAPSETLRRPRDRRSDYHRDDDDGMTSTWMGFAARRFMPTMPARTTDTAAPVGATPDPAN